MFIREYFGVNSIQVELSKLIHIFSSICPKAPNERKNKTNINNCLVINMTTTLLTNGRSQAVRIPKELRFEGREVSIRRLGDGVLLVPVKASTWPEGFFKSIRIDDANFTRPEQGELPPIVEFTA